MAGGKWCLEEATPTICTPADPTDPGDAADLSTPQGISFRFGLFAVRSRNSHCRHQPPHPFQAAEGRRTSKLSASILSQFSANGRLFQARPRGSRPPIPRG